MNALFLNTRQRELPIYAVSVTAIEPEFGNSAPKLVIRFGAEVSHLAMVGEEPISFGLPVLVPTNGYQARSSAGYVEHVNPHDPQSGIYRWGTIVGIQGMPWMRGTGSLRPCKEFGVYVYRPELNWRRLPGHTNSNTATAAAVRESVKTLAKINRGAGYILEGQSDVARAWEFSPTVPWRWRNEGVRSQGEFVPEIPQEHRLDIFTEEALREYRMEFRNTGLGFYVSD